MENNTVTTILAFWGAIVATFAMGWNLYRDIIQRGRLRVSCYIANIFYENLGKDPADYLAFLVTNIGKEPVVLTHIGGDYKNKKKKYNKFVIKPNIKLPITLKPGEYILEYSKDLSILKDDLKNLWASDSLNRHFKAPKKQVKELKKQYFEKQLNAK